MPDNKQSRSERIGGYPEREDATVDDVPKSTTAFARKGREFANATATLSDSSWFREVNDHGTRFGRTRACSKNGSNLRDNSGK